MCDAPSGAGTWLLQLQLHVVELLFGCGTDGNIHIRHTFAARPFRKRCLGGENKHCPCKRNKVLISLNTYFYQRNPWRDQNRQVIHPANEICLCSRSLIAYTVSPCQITPLSSKNHFKHNKDPCACIWMTISSLQWTLAVISLYSEWLTFFFRDSVLRFYNDCVHCNKVWLFYVFLMVFGQRWSSVAQTQELHQAVASQAIQSRISSLLAFIFLWGLLIILKR